MDESKLNEIGEWLKLQGYEIDLEDQFWMENYIFDEHTITDIAELLFDYEHRNDISTGETEFKEHLKTK